MCIDDPRSLSKVTELYAIGAKSMIIDLADQVISYRKALRKSVISATGDAREEGGGGGQCSILRENRSRESQAEARPLGDMIGLTYPPVVKVAWRGELSTSRTPT